jgi:hypothetical protein
LREWKDIFNETDFKVTDGVPMGKLFKSLSICKADELVAYGLAGGKLHYHVFFFDVFKDYDKRDEETRAAVQNH